MRCVQRRACPRPLHLNLFPTSPPPLINYPLRFTLTAGQQHDITQAEELIAGIESEDVIADRAYDSNQFRESIIGNGAIAVIPPRSNRRKPHSYDEYLY